MRITLCGSARFESAFHEWNEKLTLEGHVVYGLAVYPSWHGDVKGWYTDEQKEILDRVHKMKIDNSEAVVILNVDRYVGDSTRSEIKHAADSRKNIYVLEPVLLETWPKGVVVNLYSIMDLVNGDQ